LALDRHVTFKPETHSGSHQATPHQFKTTETTENSYDRCLNLGGDYSATRIPARVAGPAAGITIGSQLSNAEKRRGPTGDALRRWDAFGAPT
jgi:hypothetical protein